LVDLCPALLEQADRRCRRQGWNNVHTIHADACTWKPTMPVDAVLCSYSLTMIPDWFAAIDNAYAMLRPGGLMAVVDFTVSRRNPSVGLIRHGTFTRHFWPLWFGHDGVRPNADHLPYLMSRFRSELVEERRGRVPWMFGLSAPYYLFIGRKV
jgi:S-adenosylmethionine-diacylgycerolhomoserine-N-methlytransferase